MARLILVDGDVAYAERAERALRSAGYAFTHAADGLTALRIARVDGADAVLVRPPVVDFDLHGLVMRLRATAPDATLLVLDEGDEAQLALAVGASAITRRDPSPVELVRLVGRRLERNVVLESTEIELRQVSSRLAERLEAKLGQLAEAHEHLASLERRRTEYLRNVSHELATPLTPAVGLAQMLGDAAFGPLNPAQQRAVASLLTSLTRLEAVTTVLRDVSAFEDDAVRLQVRPVSIERVRVEIERTWARRGEALTVCCIDEGEVRIDLVLVLRAVDHLVNNSRKFGGPGAMIDVAISLEGDSLVVTVADDGPGIPVEDREIVTQTFVQRDGSSTRRHGGMGLGLAFVRHVAEAHGGDILIESGNAAPMRGTMVTLRLPRLGPT